MTDVLVFIQPVAAALPRSSELELLRPAKLNHNSHSKPFDDISSEEEEQAYEAQWIADMIEGRNPFAAAGPRPPYGSSSSQSAAGRGSEAAAAGAVHSSLGNVLSVQHCSVHGGCSCLCTVVRAQQTSKGPSLQPAVMASSHHALPD